jgi:hypothetical protein
VFLLGIGSLLLGVVVMLILEWRMPAFYRGPVEPMAEPEVADDDKRVTPAS